MALLPPLIEGIIPAQYGRTLEIPFKIGATVGVNEIEGFVLKIKTLQTNVLKYTLNAGTQKWNKNKGYVTFTLPENHTLTRGSNYKIQMAYTGGSFSTIGIFKYTYMPEVTVQIENNNPRNILGCYSSTRDSSEKLYSSYFTIYDSENTMFYQTKELIHNHDNDDQSGISYERLNLTKTLEPGKKYYVTFHCKTINEIEMTSARLQIIPNGGYSIDLKLDLNADLDFNNGRIKIVLSSPTLSKLTGRYKLARADSKTNFNDWVEILEFNLKKQKLPSSLYYDNTIEQGIFYQYAVFEENETGCFSSKITSQIIMADFEDLFLSDADRQLKIRFNPKVSSIKNTIQENKQDTMGGKYPFIFKNGYVNYKEFPISGLISYLQDDNNLFYSKNDFLLSEEQIDFNCINTNLSSENIHNERIFKMEVLNWLTNGKEKIFRSPTEGNYLVRLMNVSLSPLSDGLNRMLHTFSSTAYEIAEYNLEELLKYDYIKPALKLESEIDIKTKIFSFADLTRTSNLLNLLESSSSIISVNFLLNSNTSNNIKIKINSEEINIYHNFILNNTSITSISKSDDNNQENSEQDLIVIKYELNPISSSKKSASIKSISEVEIPCYQVFGEGVGINLLDNFINSEDKKISNIFYGKIKYLIITVYCANDKYYKEKECENEISIVPGILYKVFDSNGIFENYTIWDPLKPTEKKYTYLNLPSLTCSYVTENNIRYNYTLNESNKEIEVKGKLKSLYASPGLIIELGVRYTQTTYSTKTSELQNYQKAQNDFSKYANTDETIVLSRTINYIDPSALGDSIEKTKLQYYGDLTLHRGKILSNALGGN